MEIFISMRLFINSTRFSLYVWSFCHERGFVWSLATKKNHGVVPRRLSLRNDTDLSIEHD